MMGLSLWNFLQTFDASPFLVPSVPLTTCSQTVLVTVPYRLSCGIPIFTQILNYRKHRNNIHSADILTASIEIAQYLVAIEWTDLLSFIQDVPISNLGQHDIYSQWRFDVFPQSVQNHSNVLPYIRPRSVYPTPIVAPVIHHAGDLNAFDKTLTFISY